MNELDGIQDQTVGSMDGAAWHGPALTEMLSSMDVQTAAACPIPNAHTICEIVLPASASAELVLSRLRGEARTLSPKEDWPAPPPAADQDAWEADVRRLDEVHRELIEELSKVDEAGLDAPIVSGFSSVYVTLHGLVQHNVYHAGQMALIVKAMQIPQ